MKYVVGILLALVILLVGAVGYLAGKGNFPLPFLSRPTPSAVSTSSASPANGQTACTMEAKLCPDGSSVGRLPPSCEFAACPEIKTQKVTGGGVLSFPRYELSIPSTWTHTRESHTADDEKVTVTNGLSTVSIQQGGFGGSACLYPGDPDSEGPSGRYSGYVELTTQSGDKLRRSIPESGQGFGICQLTQYGWGAPTLYGHISLKVPNNPTPSDLQTLDTILKSLTKL